MYATVNCFRSFLWEIKDVVLGLLNVRYSSKMRYSDVDKSPSLGKIRCYRVGEKKKEKADH